MSSMQLAARRKHRGRDLVSSIVAATAATIVLGSVASAASAAGTFPVVVRDDSCQDVARDQSDQVTDCNPDAPGAAQVLDGAQVQQMTVADNVDAPGSVASSTQYQDAPVSQLP
jgi:hypothetical protein